MATTISKIAAVAFKFPAVKSQPLLRAALLSTASTAKPPSFHQNPGTPRTMSGLTYNSPEGGIKSFGEQMHYIQSVDLGNGIIKASGQGGWTVEGGPQGDIPEDARQQVENAFTNIDQVLKAAGLGGVDDVYLIRTYHLDIDETLEMVTEASKRHIASHRPIWTAIGVNRLADPRMKIEIEVEAKKAA